MAKGTGPFTGMSALGLPGRRPAGFVAKKFAAAVRVILPGSAPPRRRKPVKKPLPQPHPRELEWERQIAAVSSRMKDYRNQKDAPARIAAVREEQRQRVLQKEAIKLRAAQMERARRDADVAITKKNVREIVEEVVDDKLKRKR